METKPAFSIRTPIPESERVGASALFWEAFKSKIGPLLAPRDRALTFLERVLDPTHGIAALNDNGKIIGLAGFKTPDGSMVGGDWRDLQATYGTFGAGWRALPLSFFERKIAPDQLLMDGIVVDAEARGLGIGTALLDAIKSHAAKLGLAQIRLDVIDSNPRARALYERQGFRAVKTTNVWPFHRLLGFRSATEMHFEEADRSKHPTEM